ncbi:MAG: hypothetical protein ACKOC5_12560 [Chloroflexota bacterium]
MTAAEGSLLGLAIQSAEGAAETRDDQFKYLLYREAQVAPNNVILPLDPEVGGGALLRNVVKVAVNSGGAVNLIPRPDTLGMFLYGVTGSAVTAPNLRPDALLKAHALDGSTVLAAALLGQPTAAVRITASASAAAAGDLIVTGTVDGAAGVTDTLALNGAAPVTGAKSFSAISQIVLPTAAGVSVDIGFYDGSYTHTFKLNPADMFAAPFWTVRSQLAIGKNASFGEQFKDVRINMLGLEFRAPGFMNATTSLIGGEPSPVDASTWDGLAHVDSGPQFITSVGEKIKIDGSAGLSVLGGSFAAASAIPLDEQYVVGSYFPEGLEIVNRSFGINLIVKLPDEALYRKMMYDPGLGSQWAAEILRDARLLFEMKSDQDAAAVRLSTDTRDARPYAFRVAGNGLAGDQANMAWAMAPVGTRAQRQITAQLTGTFMASPDPTFDPVTITLVNRCAGYAFVAP